MTLRSVMTSTSFDVSQTGSARCSPSFRELDDHWRMIGRLRALSSVAVAVRGCQASKDRLADEREVDAHPPAFVEGAGPVVPPCERPDFVWIGDPHRVGEPP